MERALLFSVQLPDQTFQVPLRVQLLEEVVAEVCRLLEGHLSDLLLQIFFFVFFALLQRVHHTLLVFTSRTTTYTVFRLISVA